MHVIVIGCGRVGSGLAVEFTRAGHSVGHHRQGRPARSGACRPTGRESGSSGSGSTATTSRRPGRSARRVLAAVTSGDNSNILCARIARETYEIPNVVARIYDPRRAEIFQRLGIPTVPTVAWTIDHVLRRMMPERAVTEWSDSTGRLHLIERPLPADWEGRRLPAAALHGDGIRVVAVTRAGVPMLDVEDLVGQEGDVLHLIVTSGAEGELEALFPGVSVVPGFTDGGNHE